MTLCGGASNLGRYIAPSNWIDRIDLQRRRTARLCRETMRNIPPGTGPDLVWGGALALGARHVPLGCLELFRDGLSCIYDCGRLGGADGSKPKRL